MGRILFLLLGVGVMSDIFLICIIGCIALVTDTFNLFTLPLWLVAFFLVSFDHFLCRSKSKT